MVGVQRLPAVTGALSPQQILILHLPSHFTLTVFAI